LANRIFFKHLDTEKVSVSKPWRFPDAKLGIAN
jgi:hypothetical protein